MISGDGAVVAIITPCMDREELNKMNEHVKALPPKDTGNLA